MLKQVMVLLAFVAAASSAKAFEVSKPACERLCETHRSRLVVGAVLTRAERSLVATCPQSIFEDLNELSSVGFGLAPFSVEREVPKDTALYAEKEAQVSACTLLRRPEQVKK
jgi:hypothetical protein